MVKALSSKKTPMPTIHGPNGLCYSSESKAEAFGDCMEQQCSPNFQHADINHIGTIINSIHELPETAHADKQPVTTPKEVQEIIKKLPIKKAAEKQNELEQQNTAIQVSNTANINVRSSHMGIHDACRPSSSSGSTKQVLANGNGHSMACQTATHFMETNANHPQGKTSISPRAGSKVKVRKAIQHP
ncbi:hypothetical protein CBL_21120 [Carabus blaptoides fortunei]